MPESKPNRRWSKQRRWQERRRVARRVSARPDLGPGDFGYRVRAGASGLDPFESRLEFGRFQGTMMKLVLDEMLKSRSPPSLVFWIAFGFLLAAGGGLFLYEIAFVGGGSLIFIGFGTMSLVGGCVILVEQVQKLLKL